MEPIFNKVCVLVTAAFALTLVPGFRRSESSLLSVRDRGTALLVFMLLGLAEQVAVGRSSWYNHRIVAACSAGLLAGASIGTVVAAFVTGIALVLQGLGTALILAVVALIRDRDQQTAAAASAEVCALQLRMNPHFLCNALNTFATLATIAPHEIPRAAGRLRHFLRASFDQSDRTLIPLEEELTVVRT
jgi:LytS/YehU family sensor histidine kinase